MHDNHWPAHGLMEQRVCPLCGTPDRHLQHPSQTDRVFGCAPGRWDVYACKGCDVLYLDPCPTPQTIGLAYERYFTHAPGGLQPLTLKAKLAEAVLGAYRAARYGSSRGWMSRCGALLPWLWPTLARTVDAEMRHLPRLSPGDPNQLLDVGCGNGQFVWRAQQMGWRAEGIDLDPQAVAQARSMGLAVTLGGIDALEAMPAGAYNVVTLSHVIEHVHEPVRWLRALRRLLHPSGLLWLETPNRHSLGYETFGADWRDLDVPRHLVIFHLNALRLALQKAGFVTVEVLPEHPAVPMVFAASEALRGGSDPWAARVPRWQAWRRWRYAMKTEAAIPDKREFLTIRAYGVQSS